MLSVTLVPVLQDNYSYIIQSGSAVGIIDPGDSQPLIDRLEEMALVPHFIFNTHHHYDHTDGNEEIKERYGAKIIAPAHDSHRIKNIDHAVTDGETFQFGEDTVTVIETQGHTNGHVCFYFPESQILFSGDTLFSMGCGKLFEGTAKDLFISLERLKALPDTTKIYCGHEYTLNNGEFCLSIEPDNPDLLKRMEEVKALREQNLSTIPTTLALEKKTNVFLRAKDVEELATYRTLKDQF
jgi:hydroxyacylglutathione hydrolase